MKEPKIRFKGFSGEWEETTFGNRLLSIQTGTNLLGSTDNKGIPLLKMGNIQRGYFSFDKLERLDESVTPAVNCIAKYGDFYYNTRNTLELVGKGATWMQKKGIFAFNSNIARCSLDGVNTIFFNYLYNTRNVIKQVQARAKGTTSVAAVYQRDLDSIEFSLPSVDEQKALGSFFQHLDSLIQSTTKKIESLKQVKAASLQSMFPQEGETTPRVRFKGFEGEWEKVKFGEIAKISRGLTYSPFNLRDKGVRVLRSSNIDEDTFVISENDVFVNKECINIEYAQEGNILVTAANGSPRLVGKHAIIKNIGANPTVVGGFMLLISSNESAFLNASMSSCWYNNFLKVGVAGGNGSIGNLSKQDLEDTELLFPNKKDERRAIASYFTNLDRQINLQTQRLEKLKQIKAACLDNMFV